MTTDDGSTVAATDLDGEAVRAAHDDLRRAAPSLTARQVARALRAAQAVYDADRERYVQQQVAEAKLAGMFPTEDGMEIRLVMARETAAHLVMAARTFLDSTGAENYVEQTVTDRETGERYVITFQRPEGKSSHEMRKAAEAKVAAYESAICWDTHCLGCAAHLDAIHEQTERAEKAEALLAEVRKRAERAQEGAPCDPLHEFAGRLLDLTEAGDHG